MEKRNLHTLDRASHIEGYVQCSMHFDRICAHLSGMYQHAFRRLLHVVWSSGPTNESSWKVRSQPFSAPHSNVPYTKK